MDRRLHRRIPVELPGTLFRVHDVGQPIWYSEISASGCRVSGQIAGIAVGDEIVVGLGPLGEFEATVRWVEQGAIGAEFHVELEAAIVDYFAAFLKVVA